MDCHFGVLDEMNGLVAELVKERRVEPREFPTATDYRHSSEPH